MNIGIIGAAGRIGSHLAEQALAQDAVVRGLCLPHDRPKVRHPRFSLVTGDARNVEQVRQTIAGKDCVVLAVGSRRIDSPHTLHTESVRATVAAMRLADVRRLVAILGSGILDHRSGMPLGCVQRLDTPTAWLEDYLAAYEFLSTVQDVDWTLVCPSLMSDSTPQGQYRVKANHLPEGGRHIEAGDVADFILRELKTREFDRQRVGIAY
jgi:putative NADH-flavin reductase